MASSLRTPPRFVPTLTAMVDLTSRPDIPANLPADFQEQLITRVLERVNLTLERHLSDAMSEVVKQHLDALIPRLHDEIEGVVRALVVDAIALEGPENTGSVPSKMLQSLG